MSDLGTIGIAIEVRGREALRQIESDMSNVDRTTKSAARSFEVFERAGLKTAETFRYISDAAKKRLADEERVTREIVKQRDATERLAAANAKAYQSQIGSNLGLGAQGISASASASAFEQEIDRLSTKFDRIYSATKLYENQLSELTTAHNLGVISVGRYEREVEQLKFEFEQFSSATEGAVIANNRFSQHVNESGRGLNNFGMIAQQVGYQVGDFFVQIQSGTNVFVAFGQQATQLAGLIPGVAGAIAGIGISLVTAVLAFNSRTSEATEATKTFEDALSSLKTSTQNLKVELETLRLGVSPEQAAIILQAKSLEEERLQVMQYINQEAKILREEYGASEQEIRNTLFAEYDRLKVIEEQLRIKDEELEANRKAKDAVVAVTLNAEKALGKFSMMRTVAAGIANEMARAAANTQAAANAALAAMRVQFSPAGTAMSQYAGRGATSNRPLTDQYGNPIVFAGSSRPQRRPNDIDFGLPDVSGGGSASRIKKQIELTKQLTQAEKDRQNVLESIEGSLENGFMAMVEGTKSVKDAFKSMAYDIIKELYRVLVVQRLVGGISSSFGMFTGRSTGSLGLPFGLATGGSMRPNQAYLVGENGPELVIPRHSGTVVNANQTAGAMGNSGGVTVQNNITVTGSDAAMVRAEVAKMIPQITNATKAAVIDARLRGGQMKAAFS